MRFLIDADLPYSLIEIFKSHNHQVLHARDLGVATDEKIFKYANKNQYVIATFDKFLKEIDVKTLINSITVIELGRYRIRKI